VRASTAEPAPVDVDPEHRLLRAAAPVLDRIGDELEGTGLSLVLTDAKAGILTRRAGNAHLDAVLDDVGVAPGYSYAEDHVGTNGMGTAAEERRAIQVRGEEHYAEQLRDLSCVGVPIIHPVTGAVEGVLDVTCFNPDASPVLLPLVMEAVRDVQNRLADATSVREHLVLQHFLQATRRTTRPVLAVGEQLVITNGPAARLLGPDDHGLLWEAARTELADLAHAELTLSLSGGREVRVRCREIREGVALVGATLALEVTGPVEGATAAVAGLPGLVGVSAAWLRLSEQVHALASLGGPVVVSGPPGSGKASVGRSLLRLRGMGAVAEVDAARLGASVLDRLASERGPVLVRHADRIGPSWSSDIAGVLRRRAGDAPVLTTCEAPSGALLRTAGHVAVPGLAQRIDDIGPLADRLLRLRVPDGGVHLDPAARQALLRARWTDHVRELDEVLGEALAGRRRGTLTADDLPGRWRPHAAPRSLSAVERAECEVILASLRDSGGNKVEAARALGIARSTLYRKLVAYGIDDSHTGF
jgi:transcriptional regulator of acetoin/glycerol metabolism